ncbi:MAG: (2Fe-2S)-binding protein [Verrucomicrobiales bacterium]|jgi:bacterioferritin-associated ferredoxin|nr:(2Fe-2S)-binding protein [Verrucomicrobiales bacterium]
MNSPAPIAATTCRFALEGESGGPLCHCAGVSEASVRGAIDFRGVSTIEEVMETTGAGTGCRACHCRIQRVLNGLPAKCGGRFDWCHRCGCVNAVCGCEAA